MAITFSGEFTSPRTPDEVYDFLCDANKFGPLLPDFESMSVEDATHFTVKVRVVVGNIRGSAEIKMELSQAVRPIRAQYQGRGNAVGSQIAISTGFDLSPVAEGTRIAWQGEASVFGKLALHGGRHARTAEPEEHAEADRWIAVVAELSAGAKHHAARAEPGSGVRASGAGGARAADRASKRSGGRHAGRADSSAGKWAGRIGVLRLRLAETPPRTSVQEATGQDDNPEIRIPNLKSR